VSEPTGEAAFDALADELYGLRPDQFAAARDEQVKQARAAGQAGLARELGRLRRPTQSAWLINLLWRDQHEVLEQLFELASELGEAYAEASREELQRVTAQQRQLEVALMRRARELGQQAGVAISADTEREAQETLTAALAQPAVADQVRHGRLTKPVSYAGFGAPTTGAAAAPPSPPSAGAAAAATERAEPVPIDRHVARRRGGAAEPAEADHKSEAREARRAEAERQEAKRQEAERQEAERRAEAERQEAERREAERRAKLVRQRQAEQRLASARAEADSAAAALAERRQAGDDAEQQRQSLRDRLAELQAEMRDVEQQLSRSDQAVLDTAMRRLEAEHAADVARDAVARAEQDLADLTAAG
jgi:hypothetical protein